MAKNAFEWVCDKLSSNTEVSTNIEGSILKITKKNNTQLKVLESDLKFYNFSNVKEILDKRNDFNFILHKQKEPFITGEVFELLESRKIILGGFGDLIRVAESDKNFPYYPPEVGFIMRGLKQHTRVQSIRRLDHRRYEISRIGLEKVIILALNDYDLGIESLRDALDKYNHFDAILKSNPNGRISNEATSLAESLNLRIFKWGELLGKLNLEWNWRR